MASTVTYERMVFIESERSVDRPLSDIHKYNANLLTFEFFFRLINVPSVQIKIRSLRSVKNMMDDKKYDEKIINFSTFFVDLRPSIITLKIGLKTRQTPIARHDYNTNHTQIPNTHQ